MNESTPTFIIDGSDNGAVAVAARAALGEAWCIGTKLPQPIRP
jgi:hypothetical protein